MSVSTKIQSLTQLLEKHGLAATIIPTQDPHGSEYVAHRWKRREFASGFTGSAGTLVITSKKAALWTDSRYFLQAAEQLEGSPVLLQREGEKGVLEIPLWLSQTLSPGDRVGINPEVFSMTEREDLEASLKKNGLELVSQKVDLVDEIWGENRPPMPSKPISTHPLKAAGKKAEDKIESLRKKMARRDCHLHVVTELDQIAWLLNLRGADINYNPVFVAYLLLTETGGILFTHKGHFSTETPKAMLPTNISLRPYEDLPSYLKEIATPEKRLWLDPDSTNALIGDVAASSSMEVILAPNPVPGWKARKNPAELQGMKEAHREDGIAMVRFLHWMDRLADVESLDEWQVAEKLAKFRAQGKNFKGLSFETISAYGPNGAIVHYAPNKEGSAPLQKKGLLLLDSGGQYRKGTTDITRMVALGEPTTHEKEIYTTVLKGHLLLSRTVFPKGTNGYQLDTLARAPLWAKGLDYGHGTGHGVGSALNVHEGPMSISRRKNLTPLEEGHVVSIEPGYYSQGDLGVRIENLVYVAEWGLKSSFLCFYPLTMCPYNRALILTERLTQEEKSQIDTFHRWVNQSLTEHLEGETREWLKEKTAPIDEA